MSLLIPDYLTSVAIKCRWLFSLLQRINRCQLGLTDKLTEYTLPELRNQSRDKRRTGIYITSANLFCWNLQTEEQRLPRCSAIFAKASVATKTNTLDPQKDSLFPASSRAEKVPRRSSSVRTLATISSREHALIFPRRQGAKPSQASSRSRQYVPGI